MGIIKGLLRIFSYLLEGALAQILAFADQKEQKTTAASSGRGGTFLMVAGVGFEPTTFRL